jgi:diguanylate cyclase (GGDEF)-like protein
MQPEQENECRDTNRTVRILHLEGNRTDQELVAALLKEAGIGCEITTVQTRMEFMNSLQAETWELILADYALPTFDGLSALTIAHQLCPDTPFIFITGTLGEDLAAETIRGGATDYILKQKMGRLGAAVRCALCESAERGRYQRAEVLGKVAEEQVRFLAHHDALTGLANRALLLDQLGKALDSAGRQQEKCALLFLDLDRFKNINDSLGHSAGDLLLQEVARRLQKWTRLQDTVSRLGGDEFVVVLTDVTDVADAALTAGRILKEMSTELVLQGHSLSVTCSIGISVFPDHGADGETLIKNADAAMYWAKDNGRNRCQFFTQDMNSRAMERMTTENSLRLALERKQLSLEYQPQLDLATGTIIGAEALLRWRHPELGLVSPSKFIPIAEYSGTIIPIGEWVLRTACTQARQWQEEGFGPLTVAVNVSAVQFRQERFPWIVRNVLEETGLPPQYLELELTESLLLSSADVMLAVLQQLKDMGVKLSIDDFGTGYSSLSYLRYIPVYKLKIDQSFMQAITVDPDNAAIADTIIKMAKALKLKVIAEGVETEAQTRFLQEHNCDEAQGYYFSKPMVAGDFAAKIGPNRPWVLPLQAENSPAAQEEGEGYPNVLSWKPADKDVRSSAG